MYHWILRVDIFLKEVKLKTMRRFTPPIVTHGDLVPDYQRLSDSKRFREFFVSSNDFH